MTVDQMRRLKQQYGLSYEVISKETGIPYSTVSKILMGVTKSPRRDTVIRMDAYFRKLRGMSDSEEMDMMDAEDKDRKATVSGGQKAEKLHEEANQLIDPGYRFARIPGAHTDRLVTYGERESFPRDYRSELIDGVLYDLASPLMEHQDLVRLITRQIDDCIRSVNSSCRVFFAPSDVVLCETDPATVLQPDIYVICRKDLIRNGKYYGAPDLVIEILSPSTKRKDLTLKLKKYADSGVSEYWMVDPGRKKVIVCDLTACRDEQSLSDMLYLYGFDQSVPILISKGKCSVDFAVIQKDMDEYYG